MPRKKLSQEVKDQVIKRNGGRFCCKCGRTDAMRFHHIKHVAKGGEDTPDNLALLCHGCHTEWHSVEDVSHLSFDEWKQWPPCHHLIAALQAMQFRGKDTPMSAIDFVKVIKNSAQMMYGVRKCVFSQEDK